MSQSNSLHKPNHNDGTSGGSRILLFFNFLSKTAWKWKNLDPQEGCVPGAPPPWIRQWELFLWLTVKPVLNVSLPKNESIILMMAPYQKNTEKEHSMYIVKLLFKYFFKGNYLNSRRYWNHIVMYLTICYRIKYLKNFIRMTDWYKYWMWWGLSISKKGGLCRFFDK